MRKVVKISLLGLSIIGLGTCFIASSSVKSEINNLHYLVASKQISRDSSSYLVTKIVNTSGQAIPTFDIKKLPNIYQERNLTCKEVTSNDVKNIIVWNQESFFGSSLNNESFTNVLVENSLKIINRDTNVYVSFILENIVIKPDGTIGSKDFTLILNGFKETESHSYMVYLISISAIFVAIFIASIIFIIFMKLRRNKKNNPIILDGEIIND